MASCNMNISDDNILEYAEVFNLTLSIPHKFMIMGLKLGKRTTAVTTIYDDDGMNITLL